MAPATSIFVGGGTPSLVPAAGLIDVLDAIPRADGCEITIECNPDTVTDELVATYVGGGVDRLSFGVQSMVPHVLEALGRTHDVANVQRCAELARRHGLRSFNLDLIYGAAGESIDDWRRTLEGALELDPPHISAYALTVEPGTALAEDTERHPVDDDQADKYLLTCATLEAAGLPWYEISNFARPDHECRHNLLYWSQGDYLGFGCAAHSHRAGRRWWNLRTPERYVAAVDSGGTTEAAGEELDADTRALEALQLGVRMAAGVPIAALDGDELPGLVERTSAPDGDRWVLTPQGRLLNNEVSLRLRV
jgi:putative oxygen-independent coproporphyrinogen III oxidase